MLRRARENLHRVRSAHPSQTHAHNEVMATGEKRFQYFKSYLSHMISLTVYTRFGIHGNWRSRTAADDHASPCFEVQRMRETTKIKIHNRSGQATQRMVSNVRVSDDYNTMRMARTPPNDWNILKTISFTVVYE